MIGIVIADIHEFSNIDIKKKKKSKYNSFSFYEDKNYVFVNSGIGIAQAAAATQALIDKYKIKKIVNFGAVGATNKHKINEIIIPKKIYYYDVLTPWYEFGQVPNQPKFFINSFKNTKYNLATGMQFLTNKNEVKKIQKEIDVTIFDMECAAIAQIAHNNKIPIYVVKVVSDIIGDNDKSLNKINSKIKKASSDIFDDVKKIISNI